jgi:hypothetical protein
MFQVGQLVNLKNPQDFPYIGRVSGEVEILEVNNQLCAGLKLQMEC